MLQSDIVGCKTILKKEVEFDVGYNHSFLPVNKANFQKMNLNFSLSLNNVVVKQDDDGIFCKIEHEEIYRMDAHGFCVTVNETFTLNIFA